MTKPNITRINKSFNLTPDEINNLSSTIISPEEVISNGIVLTPATLANIVVNRCINYLNNNEVKQAGDFCSGMGVFIDALNQNLPHTDTLSFENNLALYEASSKFYGSHQNRILYLDTLFDTDKYDGSYDLLVGNPPYVRVQNISSDLKNKLEKNHQYNAFLEGAYDLSVAFVAKAIRLLKENGVCGLILPRKILYSSYGEKICKYLSENTKILEIIDFCDNQLFTEKTTYISILIFQKAYKPTKYNFSYYKLPTSKKIVLSKISEVLEDFKFVYESSLFEKFPWEFKNENETMFMKQIQKNGCSLTTLFTIAQGFRTGNNKAFIADNSVPIEHHTRSYIDGTNIKRGYISKKQHIIWPYYKNKDKVDLIAEDELRRLSPCSYSRLYKSIDTKDSVNWYAYSRPQNLISMYHPKIFIKEMMPRAEFAADLDGSICFSSGYALIPKAIMQKKELLAWSFILSTDVMEYQYRCIASNLHSGWFRLYKSHTEQIRLPKLTFFQSESFLQLIDDLIDDIHNHKLWGELNQLVSNAFGLTDTMLETIGKELEAKHIISMPKKTKITIARATNTMSKNNDILSDTAYPELSTDEREKYLPIELTCYNHLHEVRPEYRTLVTYQKDKKYPIQRWYKYTQGYSVSLVNQLLLEFGATNNDIVFDPFCGGGTTLIVAKNLNINSIGSDVSPLSCWISKIKTYSWSKENVQHISKSLDTLSQGFDYDFENLQFKDFLLKAFYPSVLAQTLHIQKWIENCNLLKIEKDFLLLALVSIQEEVSVIRKHGSHYRFLNDYSHVGVNRLNIKLIEESADITEVFKDKVLDMLEDISSLTYTDHTATAHIFCADIREFEEQIPKANIVITSPPYLNRNNYFSQQKVELSLLNLISSSSEYTNLVKKSFCSHVEAKLPDKPISVVPEVNVIIDAVLKQKSNNAKIPHMIAGYFNDLNKFFETLPKYLAPKAKIAFVVADCRWNGVVIPLDHLVCRIAENHGFSAKKIIVARMKGNSPQQMKEFGKIPVRESIVILESE